MFRQVVNRTVFTGAIALLVAITYVGSARAATPRLIMVSGLCLSKPVILDDWGENGRILGVEESKIKAEDLSSRPYYHLALFWGPEWDHYVREGKPLEDLHFEQANQFGRLYPAVGDEENPLILLGSASVSRVTAEGASALARHGIPARISSNSFISCLFAVRRNWIYPGVVVVLLIGAAVAICLWLVRNRKKDELLCGPN